ncbi:MAG: efflux transporter outer membrane subunit [Paracoccaceae bacterium]
MGREAGIAARCLRGMVWAGLSAAVLAACATDNPFDPPRFAFAAGWRRGAAAKPVLMRNDAWWQGLHDPVLNKLVAQALSDNLSIALARERIAGAAAEVRAVPGLFNHSSSVSASVEDTGSANSASLYGGSASLSWLLDPWGGRRAEARSAEARLMAAKAERDAAQLLVLSKIAGAYLDLRFRQALLQQNLNELAYRTQMRDITRTLESASSATRVDITRSEARVAEIEAQLPGARALIEARKNEIAVLAGSVPGQLGIDLGPAAQPRPRLSPAMGIPADLLRNRPDIGVAEQRYYEALANVDAEKAAQIPSLSLTGTISLSHLHHGGSAAQYVLGPQLAFPRLNQAAVEAQSSAARAAYISWTQTVTGAIQDVENALIDYQSVTASLDAATRAVDLFRQSRDLTEQVFKAGNATLGDVIDADTEVSQAEQTLAEARFRQAQSFVTLNVALGAGNGFGTAPAPGE